MNNYNCINDGIYPTVLKKKCNQSSRMVHKFLIAYYWPISALFDIKKLFDTIIYSHMLNFIDNFQLFCTNYCLFRKGCSITCAILHYVQTILNASKQEQYILAIFFDLTKAYDCPSLYSFKKA